MVTVAKIPPQLAGALVTDLRRAREERDAAFWRGFCYVEESYPADDLAPAEDQEAS